MARDSSGGFWRGYGSVLNLWPRRRPAPKLLYHGMDILKATPAEAFAKDWERIGLDFSTALKKAKDGREFETSDQPKR